MQNTILIHAPGRRQGRGALVLAYTALFALLMGIWAAIFALNGQSFIQYGDTLKQHYPFLVYYGRWLRQAARCVLTGAAVPTWDLSIGYGADIITTPWVTRWTCWQPLCPAGGPSSCWRA